MNPDHYYEGQGVLWEYDSDYCWDDYESAYPVNKNDPSMERTMRDLSELIKTMNEEKQEQELPLRKKKTIPINEFMAGTA